MPPAPSDSPVGRASGPEAVARRVPARIPSAQAHRADTLEALLVDLGSQIHRGSAQETAESERLLPTGLLDLDIRLGGGFPHGRLSEICGAPSSGRTSLALQLLARTLERGSLAAWIDLADAFDPASAAARGVDLERLLWVGPLRMQEAVRSSERVLRTEGFELVVLDLARPCALSALHTRGSSIPSPSPPPSSPPLMRDVTCLRLARLAASTRTALVVLSDGGSPMNGSVSATGSRSDLVLEMQARGTRFTGPPALLEALETTALLRRHRSRPVGVSIALSFPRASPPAPGPIAT